MPGAGGGQDADAPAPSASSERREAQGRGDAGGAGGTVGCEDPKGVSSVLGGTVGPCRMLPGPQVPWGAMEVVRYLKGLWESWG